MQEQREQPGGMIHDTKQAAGVLVFAARVLASPLEPILRVQFGCRYFGWPSAVALFALPMWMLFWPEEDPLPILCIWGLFILMQARARIETAIMVARGRIVHTRYNGRPLLTFLFRRADERKLKGLESLLVMLTGIFLMSVSQPLGSYLVVAGFCLGLEHSIIVAAERAQALQMHDAMLEQQMLAERFREIRGDQHRY